MAHEGHGFHFVLDEELSEADLVAIVVTTPAGQRLQLWAEVELSGRTLTLRQFAIYGLTVAGGELGWIVLRRMAHAAMEAFDVDRIRVEEARRTSGAHPGRIARLVEFRRGARHSDPDAGGAA
jgi:hypothetical protein